MTEESKDYSRGYNAGQRRTEKSLESTSKELNRQRQKLDDDRTRYLQYRHDKLMTDTLPAVLAHCVGWQIDKKTLNSGADFVRLTKIFVDNIIKAGPK